MDENVVYIRTNVTTSPAISESQTHVSGFGYSSIFEYSGNRVGCQDINYTQEHTNLCICQFLSIFQNVLYCILYWRHCWKGSRQAQLTYWN